jgi:hypothetical protein
VGHDARITEGRWLASLPAANFAPIEGRGADAPPPGPKAKADAPRFPIVRELTLKLDHGTNWR